MTAFLLGLCLGAVLTFATCLAWACLAIAGDDDQ